MAWAFVQFAQNQNSASGGAITATFGVNTTAANSVITATCANSATTGVTSVAHNSQNHTARDVITNAADAWQQRWFTLDNITGGATTVVYTPAANVAFRGIACMEISGLRTTGSYARGSWRRQSPSVTGTDATTSNTVDTSADQVPYLQVGLSFDYNTVALPAAGTGFTSRGTGWNFGIATMRMTTRNQTVGSATEAATFTMSSSAGITYTGQLILLEPVAASGDITAAGSLSITGAADLDATGSLTAAGSLSITGAADLTGEVDNNLIAAGSLSITGAADLDATGTLVAAGALSITGAADLDAAGTLAAAGSLSITGAADLDAIGQLLAAGSIVISGAADLDATGALSAAGSLSITGAAELSGSLNDITAAGSLSITGAASLSAIGQLLASGDIVITGSADLTGPGAQAPEERNAGGWPILWEVHARRREYERRKRREEREEAERIQAELDRAIALEQRRLEAEQAEAAEIDRLRTMVAKFADEKAEQAFTERVRTAFLRAAAQQNASALLAFEREMARMFEEEELAVLMALAMDD